MKVMVMALPPTGQGCTDGQNHRNWQNRQTHRMPAAGGFPIGGLRGRGSKGCLLSCRQVRPDLWYAQASTYQARPLPEEGGDPVSNPESASLATYNLGVPKGIPLPFSRTPYMGISFCLPVTQQMSI